MRADTVTDFDIAEDHLVFWGVSQADLTIAASADGTVVTWAGGSVRLVGVAAQTLPDTALEFL